jgi:hypothetical protein
LVFCRNLVASLKAQILLVDCCCQRSVSEHPRRPHQAGRCTVPFVFSGVFSCYTQACSVFELVFVAHHGFRILPCAYPVSRPNLQLERKGYFICDVPYGGSAACGAVQHPRRTHQAGRQRSGLLLPGTAACCCRYSSGR